MFPHPGVSRSAGKSTRTLLYSARMFLHYWHPTPLIATIGPFQVHWYGLIIAMGALAGLGICVWLAKKYAMADHHIYDLFFYFLVFGFIGARLYHVSNEWNYYSTHFGDIFKVWNGGLALHGGLIAGAIILWVYTNVKKLSFWKMADIFAVGLILGQAIGRWGNYFNQELFGRPANLPWSIPINPVNRPIDFSQFTFFHPTFLYESLGSFIIFGLLCWLHVRRLRRPSSWLTPGTIVLLYFILYSLLRISTESLRIDRTPIIQGFRLPIITSVVVIIIAITIWFIRRRSSKPPLSHGTTTS